MNNKKVALSMRGGDSRRTGYLGILKALEENDIKVEMMIAPVWVH